jgi:hypothetical protein
MIYLNSILVVFLTVYGVGPTQRNVINATPPSLNLRNPVNYIKWVNRILAEGKSPNSAFIYDKFWGNPGTFYKGGMPNPTSKILRELNSLAFGPVWVGCDHPDLEVYMKAIAPYLKVFKDATRSSDFMLQFQADAEDPTNPMFSRGPNPSLSKYAVLALLVMSWRETLDIPGMISSWEIGLNHSRHLKSSGNLIFMKKGMEIQLIIYETMRSALATNIIPPSEYSRIVKLLRNNEESMDFAKGIETSGWACTLGVLQSLYPHEGINLKLASRLGGVDIKALNETKVSPMDLASAIDLYYKTILSLVFTQPMDSQVLANVVNYQKKVADSLYPKHPLHNLLFLKVDSLIQLGLDVKVDHRIATLTMLLFEYHSKYGKYPTTLSQLRPNGRPFIYVDPFSNQHFIYKKTNDGFSLSAGNNCVTLQKRAWFKPLEPKVTLWTTP